MNIRSAIRSSLGLLQKRDRRLLGIATGLQMATSLLDLGGVLLFGLVGVLVVSAAGESPPPSAVTSAADALGLGELSAEQLAGLVGLIAAAFLLAKSAISIVLIRRILRFLAGRSALVSARLTGQFLARSLLVVEARPSQLTAYALGAGVTSAISGTLGYSVVVVAETTLLVILSLTLLLIDPLVTLGAVAYFGLVGLFLQRTLGGWAGRSGRATAEAEVASTTAMQEAIASYRELTVADRRSFYRNRFALARRHAALAMSDTQFITQIPKYVLESALVVGAILLVGSQLLVQNLTSAVATLALFLAAGSRVMPSVLRLQGAFTGVRGSSGNAELTYQLADELSDTSGAGLPMPLVDEVRVRLQEGNPEMVPSVEMNGVSLIYPQSSEYALHDVSVRLAEGRSLALVGSTGAGKSTFADVLLGVLAPDSGQVLIGGLAPAEAVTKWPGGIGYVPQQVALSNGSIRENVALGLPPAAVDDARVWEALERAHLAAFLRDSRESLDTKIGERGVRLSGGQRQRLGVARALYSRPRLLVMDEATSSLDAETENAISDTLRQLEGSVTTVTVAHRLATIRNADLVLYMEKGVVIARGTFDEVRKAVPQFERQASLLGL